MTRPTRWLLAAALVILALPLPLALAGGPSPPSGRIAFVRDPLCRQGNTWDDCGKGEIAVVSAGGGAVTILTHDSVTENNPVWSPNGQEIAFLHPKRHSSDQIWVMNADGTNQHALTSFGNGPQLFGADLVPALSWSPDGQSIVFSAFPTSAGGRTQLYLLDVRTRRVTKLTHLAGGATNPAWSPDGRRIAFVAGVAPNRIYVLSTQTHRIHALKTRSGGSVAGLGIAWSPNGHDLAFNNKGRVVAFDLASRTFRTLARYGDSPSWSPRVGGDGAWVVFRYGDDLKEVSAYGSGLRSILHFNSQKMRYSAPDWG